jgi:hypothetical protein
MIEEVCGIGYIAKKDYDEQSHLQLVEMLKEKIETEKHGLIIPCSIVVKTAEEDFFSKINGEIVSPYEYYRRIQGWDNDNNWVPTVVVAVGVKCKIER